MAESGPELRELDDCFKRAVKKQMGGSTREAQADNTPGTGCGFFIPRKAYRTHQFFLLAGNFER
jgi:hypothetical protein